MNTLKINSYAKVNLTLEITGVENGYHMLDSLVASIDLFDRIVLKKRKDTLSSVRMVGMGSESIPPEKNNALKAAEAFSEKFGVNGADIQLLMLFSTLADVHLRNLSSKNRFQLRTG